MNTPALHPFIGQAGRARPQRGLSLVEVMVSLAIGLVVVGAVFANYLFNSSGSRQTAAMARVTDDASLALGILRNHLAMADYSEPMDATSSGFTRRLTGLTVFGCDHGFDASTDDKTDPTAVTCATTGKSGGLLVRYEVDSQSAVLSGSTATNPNAPTDCVGASLVSNAHPTYGNYYLADNRFSISAASNGAPASLSCLGNGGTVMGPTPAATLSNSRQPLVENIVEMHLRYGVAADSAPNEIVRYVKASEVVPTGTAAADAWRKVLAVRICLLVRSQEEVLDQARVYLNCDQGFTTPTDRHIYRAFTSTVVLNNRVKPNDN